MGIVSFSTVGAPIGEVFAWHERPGALARLLPPWQPVRVLSEPASLQGGRAILGLPFGLHWVARHGGYIPGRQFVDELDWPGSRWGLGWRHTHEFRPIDVAQSQVVDRVATPVPGSLLQATFAYRHRQLADDLAAHARARAAGMGSVTVAVTGSHGLVGSALVPFLTTGGHRVIRLVRHPTDRPDERHWQPEHPDPRLLAGVDAVIHLAGASIAGRFTVAHKSAIRESRVGPTFRLAELAGRSEHAPRVFISASAIGFYGADRGDDRLSEQSANGDGFLAEVVAEWEAATMPAAAAGIRTVNLRSGIIQSPRGGTLRLLSPIFAAGLGGPIGDGRQWTSWIGIDDLIDIYHRALYDTDMTGPVNAVAPNPVRNKDYTATLASVLGRPARIPVPAFGTKVLFGSEGSTEVALASQRVEPIRLAAGGHRFRHPDLEDALAHVLGKAAVTRRHQPDS